MALLGLIASFLMGVTLGLMGGGGSILTVPIMVYLFSVTPILAAGYSLFVVGVTALVGSLVYIRKGDVDFETGFAFAIPSIAGVNISRGYIIPRVPEEVLRIGTFALSKEVLIMAAFAVLMIAASVSMIKKRRERIPLAVHSSLRTALIAAEGLVVGLIAGFVGAGGGFLIIPALVIFAGLHMRTAIGTSLMIIAAQSLAGFAGDVSRGIEVNWILLGEVSVIAVTGILAGSAFAHRFKEQNLKTAFGWFVLILGSTILLEQLRHI